MPSGAHVSTDSEALFGATAEFTVAKTNTTDGSGRGIFLSRATGLGSGTIHAYDDDGQPTSPYGGVTVNVLANDWIDGQRATTDNVMLGLVTALPDGITLSADGSVSVAAGTPVGSYSFTYRICAIVDPANCDDADVTITVKSFALVAVNDAASASFYSGGTALASVLANDKLGGLTPTTAVVTLRQVSSTSAGISLNTATGAVTVAAGTISGTYTLTYEVCERANLANCKQATVTLAPYLIDAVDDIFPKMSSKTGGNSPSVLTNDRFGNAAATTAKVKLSLVTSLIKGVTFDVTTGVFTVKPKTSSGTYPIVYQICEIANPSNCDFATATLNLSGGI